MNCFMITTITGKKHDEKKIQKAMIFSPAAAMLFLDFKIVSYINSDRKWRFTAKKKTPGDMKCAGIEVFKI